MPKHIIFSTIVIATFAMGSASYAAAQTTGAQPAAVPQTGGKAVPQNKRPEPLKLNDEQRKRIRTVLTTTHTETTLRL